MATAPVIEATAFTHPGRVRADNQDSITVAGWVSDVAMSGLRRSRHSLDDPLICAVADGLGGHSAGEVASRYTVKRLASHAGDGSAPGLAGLLAAINAELYLTMKAEPALRGMGTTLVGLLLAADRVTWFNVGDSRLYRYRDGTLQQFSVDDVPAGARTGVVTQSLGGSFAFAPIAPHIATQVLPVPSRWLLCSDGLTDMLSEEAIARCMQADDEAAVRELIEGALAAGGHDNISLIIVSVGAGGETPIAATGANA